ADCHARVQQCVACRRTQRDHQHLLHRTEVLLPALAEQAHHQHQDQEHDHALECDLEVVRHRRFAEEHPLPLEHLEVGFHRHSLNGDLQSWRFRRSTPGEGASPPWCRAPTPPERRARDTRRSRTPGPRAWSCWPIPPYGWASSPWSCSSWCSASTTWCSSRSWSASCRRSTATG